MDLILLFLTDNFCRLGRASKPLMSVNSFQQTYSCLRFLRLAIPFNFLNLFFLSSNISILPCPFQVTYVISFSVKFNLLSEGSVICVSALILLPDRLRNCSCSKLYWLNTARLFTWFLEALIHTRLLNYETIEKSEIALVLISRYLISLNLNTIGNNLSNSFSAIVSLVQATLRLLEVLASPLSPPFNASYNFLRSYSALMRASSSAFLRYSSLKRYSSCLCLSSSSSCSGVFSGGGTMGYYSDMRSCIFNIKVSTPKKKHLGPSYHNQTSKSPHIFYAISSFKMK